MKPSLRIVASGSMFVRQRRASRAGSGDVVRDRDGILAAHICERDTRVRLGVRSKGPLASGGVHEGRDYGVCEIRDCMTSGPLRFPAFAGSIVTAHCVKPAT